MNTRITGVSRPEGRGWEMEKLFHCTFSTYRRTKIFLGDLEEELRKVFAQIICEKGYDVSSYEIMPDHVHLLVRTSRENLSKVMNMVKGISARRIFQAFPDLRLDMGSNHLWTSGYHALEVSEGKIQRVLGYIAQQKRRGGLI